jgi:hypothetical protein
MDGILRSVTTKSCFRRLQPTEGGDNGGAFHNLGHVLVDWRWEVVAGLDLLWAILRLALAILAVISLVSCAYSTGARFFKVIVGEIDEMALFLP